MKIDRLPSLSSDEASPSAPDRQVVPHGDQSTAAFTPAHDTVTDRLAPRPAAQFGRYALVRVLGQGGMGEVYLAHDSKLERTVALKLPRFSEDNPIHRARFLREAKAAAVLSHPNICPVFDVGEEEGRPFLTMAYIEGPSLAEKLRDGGPLPPLEACRLVALVARAMQQAHENGFLHRDLKPSNVLLGPRGEPVVMDFGLAYRFDLDTGERLTQQGLIVGTPAYMPPEQINGQTLGPPTDVYSLGVVLYELLTGKPPFSGTLGQMMLQIEGMTPSPPSAARDGIDAGLDAICAKALAKRPGDRFLNMAEFAQALDEYHAGLAPTPARHPWLWWSIAAACAGAALVIAAAVPALRHEVKVREVAPPLVFPESPPWTKTEEDMQKLIGGLLRPVVKVELMGTADKPAVLSRAAMPPKLLEEHDGLLYFMFGGTGAGHVVDTTDAPGQGAQVTNFAVGDVTVRGAYLTFIGSLGDAAKIYVDGGPAVSMLAPMNGGKGSKHVEFTGSHILFPKLYTPHVEVVPASREERLLLRTPHLSHKLTFLYPDGGTEYIIFVRSDVQFIKSDDRSKNFPEIHNLIELDRVRQSAARTIRNADMQAAMKE